MARLVKRSGEVLWIDKTGKTTPTGETRDRTLKPRYPLEVCSYRGDRIDVTDCGCTAYQCQLHGTCSRNPGSGLRLCQTCPEYTTRPLATCPPIPDPDHIPTSDKLVITVAVGSEGEALHKVTGDGQRAYAKRCGADYVAITGDSIYPAYTMLDKFRVYPYVKRYARILYLDADAGVRSHCPDMFDMFPWDVILAHDDLPYIVKKDWTYSREVREVALSQRWRVPDFSAYPMINSGVMMFSGSHAHIWEPPKYPLSTYWCSEQFCETVRMFNAGIPWLPLPRYLNWMYWIQNANPDPIGQRDAYIVHGAGFTGMGGSSEGRVKWLLEQLAGERTTYQPGYSGDNFATTGTRVDTTSVTATGNA